MYVCNEAVHACRGNARHLGDGDAENAGDAGHLGDMMHAHVCVCVCVHDSCVCASQIEVSLLCARHYTFFVGSLFSGSNLS